MTLTQQLEGTEEFQLVSKLFPTFDQMSCRDKVESLITWLRDRGYVGTEIANYCECSPVTLARWVNSPRLVRAEDFLKIMRMVIAHEMAEIEPARTQRTNARTKHEGDAARVAHTQRLLREHLEKEFKLHAACPVRQFIQLMSYFRVSRTQIADILEMSPQQVTNCLAGRLVPPPRVVLNLHDALPHILPATKDTPEEVRPAIARIQALLDQAIGNIL